MLYAISGSIVLTLAFVAYIIWKVISLTNSLSSSKLLIAQLQNNLTIAIQDAEKLEVQITFEQDARNRVERQRDSLLDVIATNKDPKSVIDAINNELKAFASLSKREP